jgi:hypothetical protein
VGVQEVASTSPPSSQPVETPSEKYLRQIRNVVVAVFVIWIVGVVAAAGRPIPAGQPASGTASEPVI